MSKKKCKEEFIDDGRVIANMDIDGMPRSVFRRTSFNRSGNLPKKREQEHINITKEERWSIIGGIVSSYLLFGIIVFGAFALFLLFCTRVWFR